MKSNYKLYLTTALFGLLLTTALFLQTEIVAQQANLNDAIHAVVRIRGCDAAGCNVGLGSGVIIHPSGVILMANHVTLSDKNNPLSSHLEDFIIELTENARQAPQARYRARLLAAKSEADLALLGIYWDEKNDQPIDDSTSVKLPWLTLADVNTIGLADPLHILGYPVAGGAAINYTEAALGGFDENGTLLKVNASLNEGYSGGPVLVEQAGNYTIAGVVIRRRADVSLIRSIDQLGGLTWEPTARRVWAENAQIIVQGSGDVATLQISTKLQALDYMGHQGRVLAYVFDDTSGQAFAVSNSILPHSANGQLVLRQDFSIERFVTQEQPLQITVPVGQLGIAPEQLLFWLLLWDVEGARVLWADNRWQRAGPSTQ